MLLHLQADCHHPNGDIHGEEQGTFRDRSARPKACAALLFRGIAILACALPAGAQEVDEEQYEAHIPAVSIDKAMLDASKQTGRVQFRAFAGQQLIYFTTLQTMH